MKIMKEPAQPPVYTEIEQDHCSARYYQTHAKKKKGTMLLFHGANQLGNTDPRYHSLVNAIDAIGYDCLILNLQAFIDVRIPVQKDYDSIVHFLNEVLGKKIDVHGRLSFIGPSTSCLYMVKIATHQDLKHDVDSLCFISPYYNPKDSFKELLISPRSFYAQLVVLRGLLHLELEAESSSGVSDELLMFNRAIQYCCELDEEQENIKDLVIDFILKESPQSQRIVHLIKKLGAQDFLDEDLQPFLNQMTELMDYQADLSSLNSKITLIHAYTDPIFSPENSFILAKDLKHHGINHQMTITKMLAHADVVKENVIKETWNIIQGLNHFFKIK